MPQLIMLNHAAAVNSKRSDVRYECKREQEEADKANPKAKKRGGYTVINPSEALPDFNSMRSEAIVSYVMSGQEF